MANFWNSMFGGTTSSTDSSTELGAPYALSIKETIFINIKTQNLYERILKKCFHKTSGYPEKSKDLIAYSMFFNSEEGSQKNGTIPLVAKAMTDKKKLYLVYNPSIGLTKEATGEQITQIDDKYKSTNNAVSKINNGLVGMKLDFSQYIMTDLVKCYMGLIYSVMNSAHTQIKLSESVQVKIEKLRENITIMTAEDAIKQAKAVVEALKGGKSIMIGSGDSVIQTIINSESVEKALDMINSLLAADIGLSLSFVSGKLTSGMSVTGEADTNYEDIGIKDFWVSIWKPICSKLYDSPKVTYKTDRWRSLEPKMRALTYIENSTLIDDNTKTALTSEMLDV